MKPLFSSADTSPDALASVPERLRRVAGLLEVAIELDEPLRDAYLDNLARQDPELCRQVRQWLDRPASPEAADAEESTDRDSTVVGGGPHTGTAADPDRIGPYRVKGVLGSGGMGYVFRAERVDGEVARQVAIKVLGDGFQAPLATQRFRSERQILAGLDHPNIAKMHDAGTTAEGRSYLVMEVIEGVPIDRYCHQNALSLVERLRLFRKVCSAVEHAHQRLIVHRDLKPSNILVTEDGEPKLLDFGIAKLLDPASFPLDLDEATRTALRPMTPRWASPEQLRSEPITTSTDVYSLGLLLYKLLTGRLPHGPSASTLDLLQRAVSDEPLTRPSQAVLEVEGAEAWPERDRTSIAKRLTGDLDNILSKALRSDPTERYASVAAFEQDLDHYLEGTPVSATRGTWRYRAGKFVRRHRWPVATTAVVLVGALAVSGVLSYQKRLLLQQEQIALHEKRKAQDTAKALKIENDRTKATRDFLAEILGTAEKEERLEGEIVLTDLLESGLDKLRSGEITDPTVRSELLEILGRSHHSAGNYEKAISVFREARSALAEDRASARAELWVLEARAAADLGSLEAAKEAYERALDLSKTDERFDRISIVSSLAAIAHDQGRLDRSAERMREAIELLGSSGTFDPADSLATLTDWQVCLQTLGHIEASSRLSKPLFNTAHSLGYNYYRGMDLIARNYFFSGDYASALGIYDFLMDFFSGDSYDHNTSYATVLLLTGQTYGRLGRFDEALAFIDKGMESTNKALEISPADIRALYHLALGRLYRADIYERTHRYDLLRSDLEEAVEILESLRPKTNIIYVTNTHAMVLLMLDRIDAARPIVEELLEIGWRRPDFMALAERKGALPDPVPPPPELDFSLPPHIQEFLDGLPDAPYPWEPGSEEALIEAMERWGIDERASSIEPSSRSQGPSPPPEPGKRTPSITDGA